MENSWDGKKFSEIFKNLFSLDNAPVGIKLIKNKIIKPGKKIRVCRGIISASLGEEIYLTKENNACFGAMWHLGFKKIENEKVFKIIKKFVVEGEKLFKNYSALENLIEEMGKVADNSKNSFFIAPLEKFIMQPDITIFIVNPEIACRLLTLYIFPDGKMPEIKIGGPTCRMAITYPLQNKKLNISFYDWTSRKMAGIEKNKLLISIPSEKIPEICENIEICSAGKGKIEYPQEMKEFLKKVKTGREE